MVSFKFTRGPRVESVQFFQSSLPYLNNNAVTHRSNNYARHWRYKEPHPSSQKTLTISNGHYGIYFTLFNHELRRKDRGDVNDQPQHVVVFLAPESLHVSNSPEISISKIKDEVYNHIHHLKTVSRELLSSFSYLRPGNAFSHVYGSRRFLYTSAQDKDKIVELPREELDEEALAASELPFEQSFLDTQLAKILDIFENHSCPADLNIIYPLYQSLKRNDIPLPSVDHYNIILRSILLRSLDNEHTLEAIESRLSTLLTVYQDMLQECSAKEIKPDYSTYNLVLGGIFQGCVEAINIGHKPYAGHTDCHQSFMKSQEFCTVGINLFLSIKDANKLDLAEILPSLITAVNVHSHILTKDLIEHLINLRQIFTSNGPYYVGLLNLTKHFTAFNVMDGNGVQIYDFINQVFTQYKSNAIECPDLKAHEFEVYEALIEALVSNGKLPIATKFLDTILIDFKQAVASGSPDLSSFKQSVSKLLSVYLDNIAKGSTEDLHRAYNLLRSFDRVPYLPEPSTQIFCSLIARLIQEYSILEYKKRNEECENEVLSNTQNNYYNMIWALYERVAARKDFQSKGNAPIAEKNSTFCRDYLLAFSIDMNDYSKVFRIIKEIFVNDHAVKEWNVSKKLVLFLINAASANQNEEYMHLGWQFFEHQAQLYKGNPTTLHYFLSEHIPYFLQSYSEYTLKKVLNSLTINDAYANFRLETHNIYGLMACSNYLINYAMAIEVGETEKLKLLQFFSHLIQEFEDTENHYLQLSDLLIQFKENLKRAFAGIIATIPQDSYVTSDINKSCELLELNFGHSAKKMQLPFASDLSTILSVHYEKGVQQFIDQFKKGYVFDALTWKIMINRNFVLDVLEKNKVIAISDFVDRIASSNLESNETIGLISSLIDLQNEKVTIETLKSLFKRESILFDGRILESLAEFGENSDNQYFHSQFQSILPRLCQENKDKRWKTIYFKKLTTLGSPRIALNALGKEYQSTLSSLDLNSPIDQEYLACILNCHTECGDSESVNQIFKQLFANSEGNKLLMNSTPLINVLVNFYLNMGNYKLVTERFGRVASRSAELEHSIQLARFISSLAEPEKFEVTNVKGGDVEGVALSLLSAPDLDSMSQIFKQIETPLSKRQLFDAMVTYLTKAQALTGDKFEKKLRQKFEMVIRFCKVLRLKELTADSLASVVKYLGASGSLDLLNILFNKFVHGETLASILNFFFLRIRITSPGEQTLLLGEFKKAFDAAGDDVNYALADKLA